MGFIAGWILRSNVNYQTPKTESIKQSEIARPLDKYTIENLGKREYGSEIIWDEITATASAFFVQKFYFDSDGKRVSGLAHIPKNCDKCPVILQIRGYAQPLGYKSGFGTWRSAEKFAEAGFISLAPDFLGYADSASPAADIFEERFEKYTTVLNLLAAISHWSLANSQKIGLWGHSNGGQIALTVLEATGRGYPTTLWAPVSAGFPYSILFYMNDNSVGDRELRKKLAEFETVYDANKFNLLNYLDKINSPMQIHQGTGDADVPVLWTRNLVNQMKSLEKEVDYFEYPGADHNLSSDWSVVVLRDISFFGNNSGLTE